MIPRILRTALAAALILAALPASAFAAGPSVSAPTTVNGIYDSVTYTGTGLGNPGFIWARVQNTANPNSWVCITNLPGDPSTATSVTINGLLTSLLAQSPTNGSKIEWNATVDTVATNCLMNPSSPTTSAQAVSTLAGPTTSITAPGFVNGSSDTVTYSVTTPSSQGGTVLIWARVHASP